MAILCAGSALSQTCSTTSLPYALANGTTADGGQVIANLNCAAMYGLAHATGNIGIGTTAPGSLLSFGTATVGSAGAANVIRLYDTGATGVSYGLGLSSGSLNLISGYQTNFYNGITSSPLLTLVGSDVGINVSSPVSPLEVGGATTHGVPTIRVDGNGDVLLSSQGSTIFDGNYNYATGSYIGPYSYSSGAYDANTQKFSTAGAERMRITPAGAVGIGTASPTGLFYVNGQAGGATAWSSPSDARLKQDVVEIADALPLVQKLRGVRFRWKPAEAREVGKDLTLPQDEPQLGFIAQEVEKIVPEAVAAPKRGTSGIYNLKEAELIPLLVEAVKEQQTEIEALQTEMKDLKAKAP